MQRLRQWRRRARIRAHDRERERSVCDPEDEQKADEQAPAPPLFSPQHPP
jgi:hypothetical protein